MSCPSNFDQFTQFRCCCLVSADDKVKNVTNFVKNVKIVEFLDHIWNRHKKCIQQSTTMPGIGSLISEIDVQIQKFEKANRLCSVKRMPSFYNVSVKYVSKTTD